MFEDPVSEEAIERVSRRRLIEATAEPDGSVAQFSCNRTDAIGVLIIAMEKATHRLGRFEVLCLPRLRWANTSNPSRSSGKDARTAPTSPFPRHLIPTLAKAML